MAIYLIEYGDVVNQSHKLDAKTIEEAQEKYIDEDWVDDGCDFVETDENTKWIHKYRDYHWPDTNTCVRVVTLRYINDEVEDLDPGWYWVENDEWTPV